MSERPSRWIPLESNPEVLFSWAKQAGLDTDRAAFHDVYGLDPELLAMVPKPVHAVLLLFPITVDGEIRRKEEDARMSAQKPKILDPDLVFIKQTISNACGTIGLLHSLINSQTLIKSESPLAEFIKEARPMTPGERAELLAKTDLFATIHASAAQGGQTAVPTDLDTDLHFTTFVQVLDADGQLRLVELDGRRASPVDCGPSEDLLKDVATIVKEKYIDAASSLNFSMIALAPPET